MMFSIMLFVVIFAAHVALWTIDYRIGFTRGAIGELRKPAVRFDLDNLVGWHIKRAAVQLENNTGDTMTRGWDDLDDNE